MVDKYRLLQDILGEMGNVLVAYSGGVDSAFLMKVAHDVLGDNAIAALASSETYPSSEIQAAVELADQMGFRLIQIHTEELDNDAFARNAPDRCYHCKKELFGKMLRIAEEHGIQWVLHGANADDLGDYRPGQIAAKELGTRAPLQELGFAKAEIRELSNRLGLPTWDKPSFACLSSRFPYGTSITPAALVMIDKAEAFLRDLGFRQLRVRHHGNIARIEIEPADMPRFLERELKGKIVFTLKELGYLYVTLDLEGYRTGSMNEALKESDKITGEI